MKNYLLLLTGCFLIAARPLSAQFLPVNRLMLPSTGFSIPFLWQADSMGSKREANAAMLIPVTIKNIPHVFYMQFDTGSPYSLLYKNKTDAIKTKYPEAFPSITDDGKIKDFLFQTGRTPISAREITVKQFNGLGIDWNNENGVEIIGTLGTDLIDGKVAIIDYPHCTLTITDSIPSKLAANISQTGFMYTGRRILLPSKIRNKNTLLYFDTGSSQFGLLTNKETSELLAIPNTTAVQNKVSSWGNTVTANTLASKDSIGMAGTTIPLHAVTYIEGASENQVTQMTRMGIGGMTGNKLFLQYILVLDTKKQKFGLAALVE